MVVVNWKLPVYQKVPEILSLRKLNRFEIRIRSQLSSIYIQKQRLELNHPD